MAPFREEQPDRVVIVAHYQTYDPLPTRGRSARMGWFALGALLVLVGTVIAGTLYAFTPTRPAPITAAKAVSVALAPANLDKIVTSDPTALRAVTQADALSINAGVPIAAVPNPAAVPLIVPVGKGVGLMRSLDCLTQAIYYEAANEGVDGGRAVAQVILNRVRHSAYPHTVCGVVYQGSQRKTGCQFTFTCDGSLARIPSRTGWERARLIAAGALAGYVYSPVGLSTHYHADYVVPYWASSLMKTATIGRHIFYRWSGSWGTPGAFRAAYDVNEPGVSKLALEPVPGMESLSGQPARVATLAERPILENNAPATADPAGKLVPAPAVGQVGSRWVLTGLPPPAEQAGEAEVVKSP